MGAVVQGEIVRFDQVKGYGFISPQGGGEDVFLHANDLLDEKYLMRPGAVVEFEIEEGDRGPKASSVQLVSPAPRPVTSRNGPAAVYAPKGGVARVASAHTGEAEDDLVDVLSSTAFSHAVTESLLRVEPSLTGAQILTVRELFADLGRKYGWIGD